MSEKGKFSLGHITMMPIGSIMQH